MGQKVNPIAMRTLLTRAWRSRWFSGRNYTRNLLQDLEIRRFIRDHFSTNAGIALVEIERGPADITVTLSTSKPGLLIGRSGQEITALKAKIEAHLSRTAGAKVKCKINILEIKKPDLHATLVAQNISNQLKKRVAHKRAMRLSSEKVMGAGAKGVRIQLSGRLGGVEIARSQTVTIGSLPLSNFRADIDFAVEHARTTYGVIGVKVWINRGQYSQESTDAHAA